MRRLIHSVAYLDGVREHVVQNGYIVFAGDRIAELGEGNCPAPSEVFDDVVDGAGKLLLPGFINAHGHAAMSLLRGFADDLPLQSWLSEHIWPAEALLCADDVFVGTQLALLEMIETGTTTFTDMYFHMDRVAEAVIASGMRAVLGRGLVGIAPNGQTALAESVQLLQEFHGAADGRITVTLAPHAPYTCPPDYLKQLFPLAEQWGVPLQIHIAETAQEVQDSLRDYGVTPTALLAQAGLFDYPVIASHCVHVSDEDIELLSANDVRVSHNPSSNLKLGSGIAPVGKLLQKGVTVGLGTDSAASNNKLDLYEELRLTALLHKGTQFDATLINARKALQMATVQSARTLFLEETLGTLQPGAPADVQLIDITGPRYFPRHDLLSHVVYSSCGADVTDVFIAGSPVFRNKRFVTIDKEKVLAQADQIARKFGLTHQGDSKKAER